MSSNRHLLAAGLVWLAAVSAIAEAATSKAVDLRHSHAGFGTVGRYSHHPYEIARPGATGRTVASTLLAG